MNKIQMQDIRQEFKVETLEESLVRLEILSMEVWTTMGFL